jgi:hypothetical protein
MMLMLPAGVLTFMFDSSAMHVALFSTAAVLGLAQKWILFDPIASTSTILAFFRETKTMQPNPELEERIDSASEQFHQLRKRAARHAKRSHHHQSEEGGALGMEPI